ncbi:MAG: aminoglycoside phosphotransferase family protein [Anaerolineaceae bacterium]|nr:aminoglycoside phosphotransferase family protein [Anaerolineaceae bacterium]
MEVIYAGQFAIPGTLVDSVPYGTGHINDTLALRFRQEDGMERRYILQRINQFVFRKPVEVMENIERVTAHLREKILAGGGDPDRETLTLVPACSGLNYTCDAKGDFWRVYLFIEGTRTYETAQSQEQIYKTAWAFGDFQRLLADFPAGLLHETIPNFHYTPKRFIAFQDAIARDPAGRAAGVAEEIRFLEQREGDTRILTGMLEKGILPLRVTHNDTKINNLLVDERTGKGLCIVDLDTTMPGLAHYDFGDMVRTAAALVVEDDPDWRRAGISLENFDSLAHGYLDAAREILTPAEIDLLAFSGRLITLEQALRFLTDYLNGDVYYKIHRAEHNLDRARTQIRMVEDMEEKFAHMEAIIAKYR